MSFTPEQLQIASGIDAKTKELVDRGCDDATILGEMADYMPGFKRLMDASPHGSLDELCVRFPWFYRYAKVLERVAAAIQSGRAQGAQIR